MNWEGGASVWSVGLGLRELRELRVEGGVAVGRRGSTSAGGSSSKWVVEPPRLLAPSLLLIMLLLLSRFEVSVNFEPDQLRYSIIQPSSILCAASVFLICCGSEFSSPLA